MRLISLTAMLACLVLTLVARGDGQEPFDVVIHSDGGVLGQPIPVAIAVTNHTNDLLVVTSLKLQYRGKTVVPGGIDRFSSLQVPAGETATYVAPLLWNKAPLQVEGSSEYYQDRIVFREPGDQSLKALLTIKRGRWVEKAGDQHIETEAIHDPVIVPFTVKLATPSDSAGQAWWQLVSADPNYAIFLAFGAAPGTPEQHAQMVRRLESFVQMYPDHPVALDLRRRLDHMRAVRARAGLPE